MNRWKLAPSVATAISRTPIGRSRKLSASCCVSHTAGFSASENPLANLVGQGPWGADGERCPFGSWRGRRIPAGSSVSETSGDPARHICTLPSPVKKLDGISSGASSGSARRSERSTLRRQQGSSAGVSARWIEVRRLRRHGWWSRLDAHSVHRRPCNRLGVKVSGLRWKHDMNRWRILCRIVSTS